MVDPLAYSILPGSTAMKLYLSLLFVALFPLPSLGQSTQSMVPQVVELPSGKLHLKAYLWKPAGPGPFPAVLFSHGSGGPDADHTAEMPITQAANILAPFFVRHGYAFLYPFRRGHGPSATQAPFIQDVLRREEQTVGIGCFRVPRPPYAVEMGFALPNRRTRLEAFDRARYIPSRAMSTTRRDFLTVATTGAAALSGGTGLFSSTQVPGHSEGATPNPHSREFANVMVVAAHPGDAFFAMGAPVAVATHGGGQGWLLSLSLGERGSAVIPPEQYGALQHQAAEKGAASIGAKALFLAYPDGEIPVNDEAKFAVCDAIRACKPSNIVTHWKGSWHKDHRACYDIVADAIFYAGLAAIVRKDPPHNARKLYFANNWEDADGFVADTYLEITPVFDKWVDACNQFPMWRGENGFRYDDYYTSLAIGQGCLSNFKRAVSFMSSPDQRAVRFPTP